VCWGLGGRTMDVGREPRVCQQEPSRLHHHHHLSSGLPPGHLSLVWIIEIRIWMCSCDNCTIQGYNKNFLILNIFILELQSKANKEMKKQITQYISRKRHVPFLYYSKLKSYVSRSMRPTSGNFLSMPGTLSSSCITLYTI